METTATPPAAPCADCGTTGGRTQTDSRRPWRGRGLCRRCYHRHAYDGTLGRYTVLPPLAKPTSCLGCGVDHTGWYQARGLCSACYQRAKDLDIHAEYPACGPRPVPFMPAYVGHPEIPTGIITPQMLGIRPGQPALTLTTWPLDHLCARYDRPRWTTARWNRRPRDPGFAAYHDADTAEQRAA